MSGDQQPSSPAPNGDAEAPKLGTSTAPALVLLAAGAIFFSATFYTDTFSGSFRADVYDATAKEPPLLKAEDPLIVLARQKYGPSCGVCHQATGMGTPGQCPPLAGSDWVVGGGPNRIIRLVLDGGSGPIKINGADFSTSAAMIAWRDLMTDDEIAAVLSYVRNEWGNKAPPVKPQEVKAIRDETKSHAGTAYSPEELLKLPDSN